MSVDFIRVAREFYTLEAIDLLFAQFAQANKEFSMLQGYVSFYDDAEMDYGKLVYSRYGIVTSRAKEKLMADFILYREKFISSLSVAFRDYLIVAMAGEARNARSKATRYSPSIPYVESRSSCMKNILQFSRYSLINTFEELYNPENTSWDGSFGGAAWYSGVKALQIKDDVSFVDHCIDLQHNCGSMFNKSDYDLFCVSSSGSLTAYLDFKRYANASQIIEEYVELWTNVSDYLRNILDRAYRLGIMGNYYTQNVYSGNSAQTHSVNNILQYVPLRFGQARLIGIVESDEDFELSDEIDDNEDSEESFSFNVWIRDNKGE